jgi:putative photosynthetic complex assembly protein 2
MVMALSLDAWTHLYLYPLLVTLVVWGGLTMGLIWLNQHGARAGRLALLLLLPLLLLAHQQLWAVHDEITALAHYRAFLAGMFIWAWHELAFYCGVLSGPWRVDCPPGLSSWGRFGYALCTHAHHEIAVCVDIALLLLLHHDAANLTGLLTFGSLWALQHSAKLNVFLGVRNLKLSVFPGHIRYLGTFWAQRPYNPFFFISMAFFGVLAVLLWLRVSALAPHDSAVGMALLATMMTLGVLEHMLLVLPTSVSTQPVQQPVVNQSSAHTEPHRWRIDS